MSGFSYSKWDNLEDSDDESPAPAPAPAPAPSKPKAGTEIPNLASLNVEEEDPRAEVEKLKAKKRAERLMREKAKAEAGPAAAEPLMTPVEPPAPVQDANAAAAQQTSTNAEQQLAKAEKDSNNIAADIAELELLFEEKVAGKLGSPMGSTAAEAQRIKSWVMGLQGEVGKLQNALDEIFLGEIENDEERAKAKERRKAVNKRLEGEYPEKIVALKKQL
ncbi:hypothetical protein TeGR_g5590 [Tetraparma gracilis]|uniref:Uncharacterized protein n=1 Tax=Tetraparma gracilis TaxID=2962635 RepID=A0ABQ6N3D9_9STRA|nr:hypothetical protein TeGR_g5590 [Tetraparma gracilis]